MHNAAGNERLLREIEGLIGSTIQCDDIEGFDYDHRVVPSPDREARQVRKLAYNGGALSGKRRRPRKRLARSLVSVARSLRIVAPPGPGRHWRGSGAFSSRRGAERVYSQAPCHLR